MRKAHNYAKKVRRNAKTPKSTPNVLFVLVLLPAVPGRLVVRKAQAVEGFIAEQVNKNLSIYMKLPGADVTRCILSTLVVSRAGRWWFRGGRRRPVGMLWLVHSPRPRRCCCIQLPDQVCIRCGRTT